MSENRNECPICISNAILPVATKCGHIFCKECIKNWINIKGKLECPVCKNGIKLNEMIELFPKKNNQAETNANNIYEQEKNNIENQKPTFFQRFINNFGFYGYRNNTTLRLTNPTEKQRNFLTLSIAIFIIVIAIYFFNS